MDYQKIIINQISVQAHIGLTEAERFHAQELHWMVEVSLDPSQQSVSDLNCIYYDQMTQAILEFSQSKHFWWIENMTLECFQLLRKQFPSVKKLKIRLKKVSPPIKEIQGGVIFECEG